MLTQSRLYIHDCVISNIIDSCIELIIYFNIIISLKWKKLNVPFTKNASKP